MSRRRRERRSSRQGMERNNVVESVLFGTKSETTVVSGSTYA